MKSKNEKGLTLVELLVVIVLIGLISVVVAKNVVGKGDIAKAELNVVRMNSLKNSLGQFRLKFNTYPGKLDELVTGSGDTKNSGQIFMPLIEEDELKDMWGFPYVYKLENDGRVFSLKSLGSDGLEGGEGAKQDVTVRP
jgi:general secretion pathway protein G